MHNTNALLERPCGCKAPNLTTEPPCPILCRRLMMPLTELFFCFFKISFISSLYTLWHVIRFSITDIHIYTVVLCSSKGVYCSKFTHFLTAERKCHRAWWRSGKFGVLHPQGHRFKPHSSRHVGTLGKSFTRSCLYVMWRPARMPCS